MLIHTHTRVCRYSKYSQVIRLYLQIRRLLHIDTERAGHSASQLPAVCQLCMHICRLLHTDIEYRYNNDTERAGHSASRL